MKAGPTAAKAKICNHLAWSNRVAQGVIQGESNHSIGIGNQAHEAIIVLFYRF